MENKKYKEANKSVFDMMINKASKPLTTKHGERPFIGEKMENIDRLIKATLNDDLKTIKVILRNYIPSESNLMAMLWWASRKGNLDIISFIINYNEIYLKFDLQLDCAIENAKIGNKQKAIEFLKSIVKNSKKSNKND